jgi:myosin protein heavy chain
VVLIKAKRSTAKKLLERLDINGYLRRAQKNPKFKELVVDKLAHLLGLVLVEEEESRLVARNLEARVEQVDHLSTRVASLQSRVGEEEDAKRRTLLRYVQVVKAQTDQVGVLHLAESGIGDEEIHALAALLRGSRTIRELNVRNNAVTDAGARALAAVLAGPPACSLRLVDLRNNKLSDAGVRCIAEALERAQNTRHVYVHAGGKIEALGTVTTTEGGGAGEAGTGKEYTSSVAVETVCVVDAREQVPKEGKELPGKQRAWELEGDAEPAARVEARETKSAEDRKVIKDKKPSKRDIERAKDELKLRKAESGWKGRAGGFDITLPDDQHKTRSLPPLTPTGGGASSNNNNAAPAPEPHHKAA